MKTTFRQHAVAAAIVLAPLGAALVAQPAAAQSYPQYRVAQVAQVEQGRVSNLSLNSNAGLAPGATLRVQAYATPGARWASATLGDSIRVRLHERAPGEYVGTHVIARGEHIDPRGLIRVQARWGEEPVAIAFNYPPSFQALAMGSAPAAVSSAFVRDFSMSPSRRLEPGEVVHFRLEGTPRARAFVRVPDVVRGLPLREVRPGVYVGRYTIRQRDDVRAFRDAEAVLRSGDERVVAQVERGRGHGYGRDR